MKIKNIILLGLLCLVFLGCTDEEELESSGTKVGFEMPQGNHDYDKRIMEYYDKFNGVCLLYRYEEREAYWTSRYYYKAKLDPLTGSYYPYGKNEITKIAYFFYNEPDTNYINQYLDLLQETFLGLYKEDALRKYLPLKLLLTSTLTDVETETRTREVNAKAVFDKTVVQLLFAGCNEEIVNMTQEEKENYIYDVNRMFLYDYLAYAGMYNIPSAFSGVTSYDSNMANDMPTLYKNGLLNSEARASIEWDWRHFLDAIFTTSYEDMITYYPDTDRSYKGILCSDKSNGKKPKDSMGKIRKKYDAMLNYFQEEFGINIHDFARYYHK